MDTQELSRSIIDTFIMLTRRMDDIEDIIDKKHQDQMSLIKENHKQLLRIQTASRSGHLQNDLFDCKFHLYNGMVNNEFIHEFDEFTPRRHHFQGSSVKIFVLFFKDYPELTMDELIKELHKGFMKLFQARKNIPVDEDLKRRNLDIINFTLNDRSDVRENSIEITFDMACLDQDIKIYIDLIERIFKLANQQDGYQTITSMLIYDCIHAAFDLENIPCIICSTQEEIDEYNENGGGWHFNKKDGPFLVEYVKRHPWLTRTKHVLCHCYHDDHSDMEEDEDMEDE